MNSYIKTYRNVVVSCKPLAVTQLPVKPALQPTAVISTSVPNTLCASQKPTPTAKKLLKTPKPNI